MHNNNFNKAALGLVAIISAGSVQAGLLDLSGQEYFTYGNTNSYSMPISAYRYDLANGGGTGPGNPFYIASTPGAIKDLVVIYTGASGVDVTTNAAGFEDAYQTPSGSHPLFASTTGIGVVAPTGTASKGITTTYDRTWDASLSAMKTFLNGGNPLFLFNNNETKTDEHLAIWAKVWITDGNGAMVNHSLYLSNTAHPYGLGGMPFGDATTYNPGEVQPAFYGIDPATGRPLTDYVLSGGDVCIDKATGADALGCGPGTVVINHNLGANQVAYVGDVPLLDLWLDDLFKNASNLGQYSLHMQLNLGCDPDYLSVQQCDNFKIDNGFEQLFLASTASNFVPEPSTVALFGLGLLGLAALRLRQDA